MSSKGPKFLKLTRRLERYSKIDLSDQIAIAGSDGHEALSNATPVDTQETARSWYYEKSGSGGNYQISWCNKHTEKGIPVVILLHYGHATRSGTRVSGRNFIDPAMTSVFSKFLKGVVKEVQKR